MAKKYILAIVLPVLVFGFFVAQNANSQVNCLTITQAATQEQRRECERQLADIEAQLEVLIKQQQEQRKQTGTIAGDINYLNSQINALRTKIKARSLAIAQLQVEIKEKVSTINELSTTIERQHESIAQLIRNTNDFDNANVIHLILSDQTLSEFYGDLESYASIKRAVKTKVEEIRGVKTLTEEEKQALEQKKDQEADARYDLESSQKKVEKSEKEKQQLLSISKQKEAEYEKLAAEKKAQAAKIRAALFPLRDSAAIPFGTALSYAQQAQSGTGVRPALVLAILKQESNLGANVGTCNRATDPPSKHYDKIMHPTRDIPAYKRITTKLGLPLVGNPLSCPQSVGWGGAMGPSQFIPSTWELFASKIASILGVSGYANPWEPRHAITATSVYLGELGAGSGSYSAEKNAACRYFSGSSCPSAATSTRASYIISYGNNVMALAAKMQADIDFLADN